MRSDTAADARWPSIAWYASDVEAQVARSMLEARGIRARVDFEAAAGMPRTIAPAGLQAPGAGYHLRVSPAHAVEARWLVDASAPRRLDRRLVWFMLLVTFGTPLLLAMLNIVTSK